MNQKTQKQIKELEKMGYIVKRAVKTTKHTFEVEDDTLAQFLKVVARREMKIKSAVAEALEDWLAKQK